MKKLLVFLFLMIVAVLVAGAYGALHNQISYTVSSEYFTKFKFRQFGLLESALPERVRASAVGFFASWWMGIPIGVLVGGAGFIHRGNRRMLWVSLWAFLVVALFALFVGLVGLLYGFSQTASIDLGDYDGWHVPPDVQDLRRFLCAGYMHNASYLGGALAVVAAWIFHLVVRMRTSSSRPLHTDVGFSSTADHQDL